KYTNFLILPVDAGALLRVFFPNRIQPLGSNYFVNGDTIRNGKVFLFSAHILFTDGYSLNNRLMLLIIGAKYEHLQQFRKGFTIRCAVRTAHRSIYLFSINGVIIPELF